MKEDIVKVEQDSVSVEEVPCAEMETNEKFLELVQNATTNQPGEIVYALDEAGNQVAVGLLIPGAFQEVSAVEGSGNSDYIAAEEECASTNVAVAVSGQVVKNENSDVISYQPNLEEICQEKNRSVIKTYKPRKNSKKTLKQIRLQIEKQHKERKRNKKQSTLKDDAVRKKKWQVSKGRKKSRRKFKTVPDRMYKVPSSVRRQYLASKNSTHSCFIS